MEKRTKTGIPYLPECGPCQDALGNDTLKLKESWYFYWNQSQAVGAIQDKDTILQNLTLDLNQTSSRLGVSGDRMSVLLQTVSNLTTAEPAINASVQAVMNQVCSIFWMCVSL